MKFKFYLIVRNLSDLYRLLLFPFYCYLFPQIVHLIFCIYQIEQIVLLVYCNRMILQFYLRVYTRYN
nr:MAG TPA: hypothetical protein [Caudoviricetes sp.]